MQRASRRSFRHPRYLQLTTALVGLCWSAASCGPVSVADDEGTPTSQPSRAVTAPTPPSPAAGGIKNLISFGKDLTSAFSAASSGVSTVISVATFLGIIPPTPDPIEGLRKQLDDLAKQVDARAANLDWKMEDLVYTNLQWAPVHAALNAARDLDIAGGERLARGGAYDANSETGVEAASALANFERLNAPSATDGPWKQIISNNQADIVEQNQVFDWRLAMPWLTQLISWRLFIMGAVDPDFAHDKSFRSDMETMRSALQSRLAQMVSGIRCETHDRLVGGAGNAVRQNLDARFSSYTSFRPPYVETDIACADVNTGFYAMKTVKPDFVSSDGRSFPQYPCYIQTTAFDWHLDLSCLNNWGQLGAIQDHLRREVLAQMPVFEVQSIIDTLYRYMNPEPQELTAAYRQIPLAAVPSLCVAATPLAPTFPQASWGAFEGEWGFDWTGVPVTVERCLGNDSQSWVYDRATARIFNPALDLCLERAPFKVMRTLSPNPVPNAFNDALSTQDPLVVGAYVAAGRCAVDAPTPDNPLPPSQQWSYDAERQVLTNGEQSVLDVRWGALGTGTPVWLWDYNGGNAQKWRADQPLGFTSSPPTDCGVMTTDQGLHAGESVTSCDGRFVWRFESDGNFVLYENGSPIWATGTANEAAGMLILQGDGNLVVYNAMGAPLWASNTDGHPGSFFAIQNDGNLVVYDPSGHPLWASNTCCR